MKAEGIAALRAGAMVSSALTQKTENPRKHEESSCLGAGSLPVARKCENHEERRSGWGLGCIGAENSLF